MAESFRGWERDMVGRRGSEAIRVLFLFFFGEEGVGEGHCRLATKNNSLGEAPPQRSSEKIYIVD